MHWIWNSRCIEKSVFIRLWYNCWSVKIENARLNFNFRSKNASHFVVKRINVTFGWTWFHGHVNFRSVNEKKTKPRMSLPSFRSFHNCAVVAVFLLFLQKGKDIFCPWINLQTINIIHWWSPYQYPADLPSCRGCTANEMLNYLSLIFDLCISLRHKLNVYIFSLAVWTPLIVIITDLRY